MSKSKLPSDPLEAKRGSADRSSAGPVLLAPSQSGKRWRQGPWLPIAAAVVAVLVSVALLYWLWQMKGRSALAANGGSVAPDPDPPIVAPPVKELLKPAANELPGRMPLETTIEMLVRAAPAIPVEERQFAANPRIARWEIRFPSGNTLENYARQLDALNIELGVIGGSDRIVYASGFTKDKPERREGRADDEQRFYMTWRAGALRTLDNALLSRAKISTADRIVAQFYPPALEKTLAELEQQFAAKRNLSEVRRTVFALVPLDKGFEFQVVEQEYVSGEVKRK